MSSRADIQMFAGEDATIPDTIYQADGVTLQNITGWSVAFTMWDLNGPALVTKTTAGGGVVLTTPASGLLTVTLAAADTASLQPKNYQYRIERTDPGADAVLTYGLITLMAK